MQCPMCKMQLVTVNNSLKCLCCGYNGEKINITQIMPYKSIAKKNEEIIYQSRTNLENNLDGSMDYCISRGITKNSIDKWKIGYMGEAYNMFSPMWYKRLLFPIHSNDGRYVIGFGGRIIESVDRPKYVNSYNTWYYNKSISLYGYNNLRKNASMVYLCEGYMDAVSMTAHGYHNTVASLGTSLTVEHAHLLRKATKNICIAYDADEGGEKATLAAINTLINAGFALHEISVLKPKEAKDVDEALTKKSALLWLSLEKYLIQRGEYKTLLDIKLLKC